MEYMVKVISYSHRGLLLREKFALSSFKSNPFKEGDNSTGK